tara:strand:+ start:33887 stop:35419 length:1533 start_codon:yes stop_codon:yes gene_type:complete
MSSELNLSPDLLEKLVFGAADGVHVLDQDGNVVICSHVFAEILGYSFEEAQKLNVREWDDKFPKQDLIPFIKELIKSPQIFETKHLKKDGELLDVEINARGIELNGQFYVYASTRDITEAKKQKKAELYNSKMASIGELVSGVGHEINNPLAIIQGFIALIKNKYEKLNTPEAKSLTKAMGKIESSTKRISRIVADLGAFTRSEIYEKDTFFPILAMENSYRLLKEIHEKDGIQIEMVTDSDCENIAIDGSRGNFLQVFMGVVGNAKDAVLATSNEVKTIQISYGIVGNQFEVKVKDNGCGASKEVQEKMFDPFFSTKQLENKTGIGLSLSRSYVEDMNGTVDFNSEIGKGSEFILRLPISNKNMQADTADTKSLENSFTGLRLLLVDDEEDIRFILGDMLEELGFKVTTAENGKEGLDIFLNNPDQIDIILSDMRMPKMDGPTFLKSVRSHKEVKQPKFVFFTGGINIDFESQDNELYGLYDAYFLKPFDLSIVEETLNSCLFDKQTAA